MKASGYLVSECFPDGVTGLFSTRSGSFLCIDSEWAEAFLAGRIDALPEGLKAELMEAGMLIPDDEDELAEVLGAWKMDGSSFRVLTTTACNAACPYCYEKGTPRLLMSEETAEETADFLVRRQAETGSDMLHLEWFGGEPLLNPGAIDRICDRLRDRGVRFISWITTNASLLCPEMIPHMKSHWNLTGVQVSLDGAGEIHEERKGLPQGAFDQTICCIHALLDSGCQVKIRIVHTGDFAGEAGLIRFLGSDFQGTRPFVYLFPLYETPKEQMRAAMEEILSLEQILEETGLVEKEKMYRFRQRRSRCFAADGGLTIAPDGRLYSCSHAMRQKFCIGTVREFDPENPIYQTFIRRNLPQKCLDCICLPCCMGGCRAAEAGMAATFQCFPYHEVMDKIVSRKHSSRESFR